MVEIVEIVRLGDVVELVVRRGDELARYAFTEAPASVLPAAHKDASFHRDFARPEDLTARIMMFAVARQAFRGMPVRLPLDLP
jgi:hypothetical protein